MKRSALCPDRIPTIARQNPAHGLPTSCTGFCRRSVSCLSGSTAAQESARVPVAHSATRPGFVSFGGFVTGQKPQPVASLGFGCDIRHQHRRGTGESMRQLADVREADVPFAALDHADVVPVKPSLLCERLLGQISLKAQPSEIITKLFGSVGHRGSNTTRFALGLHTISGHTIDMHTMSVIPDRHDHEPSASRHGNGRSM